MSGQSQIESNMGLPNENLVQEEMAGPAKDTNVHISLVASDLPESNKESQKNENQEKEIEFENQNKYTNERERKSDYNHIIKVEDKNMFQNSAKNSTSRKNELNDVEDEQIEADKSEDEAEELIPEDQDLRQNQAMTQDNFNRVSNLETH